MKLTNASAQPVLISHLPAGCYFLLSERLGVLLDLTDPSVAEMVYKSITLDDKVATVDLQSGKLIMVPDHTLVCRVSIMEVSYRDRFE